jgi:hypothetical protein
MEFTAVARRTPTDNAYDFDEEFVKDFNNAATYCAEHPDHYLRHDFGTSRDREYWLAKARAYGEMLDQPLETRRIKHTDSANPEHGILFFVIESKMQAELRRKKRKEATEDRERRRKNGEVIRRGGRRLHVAQ